MKWAKDKLDNYPKAKRDLGPLLDALGRTFMLWDSASSLHSPCIRAHHSNCRWCSIAHCWCPQFTRESRKLIRCRRQAKHDSPVCVSWVVSALTASLRGSWLLQWVTLLSTFDGWLFHPIRVLTGFIKVWGWTSGWIKNRSYFRGVERLK